MGRPVGFEPMTVVAGPFFAAAGLLGAAGVLKLVHPTSTVDALRSAGLGARSSGELWPGRLLGLVELVVAMAAVLAGGRIAAAFVAVAYLGFALFTARLLQTARAGASCGCFGADDAPAVPLHVVVNVGIAVCAALAVVWPTDGLGDVVHHQPLGAVPFVVLSIVLGWLWFAVLTVVPDLQAAMAEAPRPNRSTGRR